MTILVLDAEALSRLARPRSRGGKEVRAALEAARRLGREVVTPAVILAELYRGRGHNDLVDACLSRDTGILVRVTDRALARLVGGVLASAGTGSERLADAHVVATAVEQGGGVILTGDVADLRRLSATFASIHVQAV